MDVKTVIAFIPVRGGSKSIPLKNIKPFCGKPLVCWVIESLLRCELVTHIVVSTDSDEIEDCVKMYERVEEKQFSVFRRSSRTATDTASTESAMVEYIMSPTYLGMFGLLNPTFMLVQATSPLTTTDDFTRGLELFKEIKRGSVLSGVKTKRFHWTYHKGAKSYVADYSITERPRRQEYDGSYVENGAFYISTAMQILDMQCRLTAPVYISEMPEDTLLEIDEPSDWEKLEELMRERVEVKFPLPTSVFLDVDGTLTDGKMTYSQDGKVCKNFNTKDGYAISLLKSKGVNVYFISTEDSNISRARAKDLGVEYLYVPQDKDKMIAFMQTGNDMDSSCFVGDGFADIELLKHVQYAFCPSDSVKSVLQLPNVITLQSKGGDGVVSETLSYFKM